MHYPELNTLLATHAETLQALLPPHLWPVRPFKVEQFGPLTKYTLGQLPDGRWAMLHYLNAPDDGPPHSHPCAFESRILSGSYLERIYHAGRIEEVLRPAGFTNVIAPDCIHSITALPEGEVWTLVFAGPVVRKWQHYPDLAAG